MSSKVEKWGQRWSFDVGALTIEETSRTEQYTLIHWGLDCPQNLPMPGTRASGADWRQGGFEPVLWALADAMTLLPTVASWKGQVQIGFGENWGSCSKDPAPDARHTHTPQIPN